jgi:hypothetical protein
MRIISARITRRAAASAPTLTLGAPGGGATLAPRSARYTAIRRLTLAAAGFAVAAAMALSGASPVSASSQGCTGVSDGFTCFNINGTGTHVDSFVQIRDKVGGTPTICNYQANFTVEQNGAVYWSAWSATNAGCMYFWRATRTVTVNGDFRNPSKACGSWYENGSRLGTACNLIYR